MSADPMSSVVTSLTREQIIPTIIPSSYASTWTPTHLFSVHYPANIEVLLGNHLTVEQTQEEPTIVITPMSLPEEQADSKGTEDGEVGVDTKSDVSYTLVMTDPDAPSREDPKFGPFRHWVVTGLRIPTDKVVGSANLPAMKTKAATTPYRPPGPPPNSGVHRYVFLLFQEPFTSPSFSIPEGAPEYGAEREQRRHWDATKFAERYGLKLVGANYFLVDSTV